MRITLVTLFALFLSSCSIPFLKQDARILSYEEYKNTLPTKITNEFKLKGKLFLFINNKGQTGKILWSFKDNKDTIHLLNPFNTKIAEIVLFEPEKKVILKFSKNKDKDSEELISKIFGKKENIFLLKEFILNPPKQLSNIRDITIRYKNWNIVYQGNKVIRNHILPNTIEFEKNNISLKIFISDWIL
jgi:outer membrane biogenesis lipoprotein LolB